MAKKKKENTLSYLQMPLPEGVKYSKMTKVAFGGLNKRYTLDSGELSMENNISTSEYPYLVPSESKKLFEDNYTNPISMFAFDDFIIVVYMQDSAIKLDYIKGGYRHTGILRLSGATIAHCDQRSIVQFNVYDTPTDPLTGQYVKKLLIFPDKCSMYMNIVKASSNPANWEKEYENADNAKKGDTALMTADLGVMYFYEIDDIKYYYTVVIEEDTEDGDENRVTYKRVVQKKYNDTSVGSFLCDSMEAIIETYYNDTPEIDESGATIYPPPDTVSHNCYYRNTYNHKDTGYGTDIYRWCEYKTKNGGTAYGWKVSIPPAIPDIKYATVHLSRVFGVDDNRVYASGYNNYASWNLDTIDEYNEANAWCSPSQSNTKAGGTFTGITNFQGHIVCFKRDFMHEIYNTKNPFRLQDIYAEGTIDNRTIQDVDGKLIFVSEDDVKIYTGSNPRIIGHNLNMSQYTYAVSGTDNRNYYLYCEDASKSKYLYVYDTFTGLWSEQSIENKVLNFAHNKSGMYMLCDNGCVYKMNSGSYMHKWSFETDLITNKTVDIKHIKKLQMLVDIPQFVNNGDFNIIVEYGTNDITYANMQVYILYDDEVFDKDKSHLVYTSVKEKDYGSGFVPIKPEIDYKLGKFPIRVKPRKTANYGFRLHFEGAGYVKLYELEIFIEAGGDLFV